MLRRPHTSILLQMMGGGGGAAQMVAGGGNRGSDGGSGGSSNTHPSMVGIPQSVQDAMNKSPMQRMKMKQAQDEQDPDQMKRRFLTSAHTELGLTKEEFEARKIKASAPYKVKKGDKEFDITSSARVQQVMTQGTAERAALKAKDRLQEENKKLYGVQAILMSFAFLFAAFLWVSYARPVIDARTKRARMQERRYKEIFLPAVEREEARKKALEEARQQEQLTLLLQNSSSGGGSEGNENQQQQAVVAKQ